VVEVEELINLLMLEDQQELVVVELEVKVEDQELIQEVQDVQEQLIPVVAVEAAEKDPALQQVQVEQVVQEL
jgi:hypothetical protein